jgi:uncharacterized protein YegJ (DUF2314 family)
MLVKYDLHHKDVKLNSMIKVTYKDINFKESFWVWIEEINNNKITGIISNKLHTNVLELGQKIIFDKSCIKEISDRLYTKEDTLKSIGFYKISDNPITKYFESINSKFIYN